MKSMKIVLVLAVLLNVSCIINRGYAQVPLTGTYATGEHSFSEENPIVVSSNASESFNVSGTANVVVNSSTGITLKPGFKASALQQGGKFHAFISSMLQYTLESQNATLDTLGSASITVTGGSAPYSFNWNGEQYPTMQQLTAAIQNSPEIQSLGSFDFGNLNDFEAQITGAQRSELESDMYEVVVKDKRGTSVKIDVPISNPTYWYNSLGLSINGNSITKMDPDGWNSGYATSLNFIEQGEDGMLMFYLGNLNSTQAVGFKSLDAVFDPGYADMAYGVLVENNEIKSITDGVASAPIATYNEGDKLYLEKKGGNVLLKKNKEIIHSTPLNEEKDLQADVALFSLTAQVNIAAIRLRVFPKINGVVSDYFCTETSYSDGAININLGIPQVLNSLYNFHFLWVSYGENGNVAPSILAQTQNISGLAPGKYALVLSYTIPGQSTSLVTKVFYVGFGANWVHQANTITTTPNDRSLKKATAYSTVLPPVGDNAGASTTNNLNSQNSGLEWYTYKLNASSPVYLVACGLSNSDLDVHFSSIQYAIATFKLTIPNLFVTPTMLFIKNGSPLYTFHSIAASDATISAEIIPPSQQNGNYTLKYFKDGGLSSFYSYSLGSQHNLQVLDASIFYPTNSILDAKTSFPCEINYDFDKPFAKLNKKLDGGYYICDPSDGNLYFKFDEEYIPGNFTYTIYNWQNNPVITPINSDIKDFGDNRYILTPTLGGLSPGMYILETINDKNEKMYLRFRKG